MIVIGAGMAGLLAANMLARHRPMIVEAQEFLPNNHSAVLRFRSSVVGDVLGIPFRQVNMIKCPLPWQNPVSDSLAYSFKCTGQYRSDRSITSGLVTEQRYIAPPDLIERMSVGVDIKYNSPFMGDKGVDTPIISTLPMPLLMGMLNYDDIPEFIKVPGYNIKATIEDCDAFASILIPDPSVPVSRISITGNELIIELPMWERNLPELIASYAVGLLGIDDKRVRNLTVHEQKYSKIAPINNDVRQRFIAWATDHHNIYSLGRYATWRPNLLLDDLVNDIRKIEGWIIRPDQYAMRQHRRA